MCQSCGCIVFESWNLVRQSTLFHFLTSLFTVEESIIETPDSTSDGEGDEIDDMGLLDYSIYN